MNAPLVDDTENEVVPRVVRLDEPGILARITAEPVSILQAWAREARLVGSPSFRKPLNGQIARMLTIRSLIRAFQPDVLIETGTFRGYTTKFFSQFALPVYSIDVNPGFYHAAKLSLAGRANVTLICGDSSNAMDYIGRETRFKRPLAYLDAHWGIELPLPREVELLSLHWREFIAVIDDCKVPHDPDYGFDTYSGEPISIDVLNLTQRVAAAYPAVSARDETGARRGGLYLAQGEVAQGALEELIDRGLLTITRASSDEPGRAS